MTYNAVEKVISMTTLETLGVDISPHLFRTAGASSCAVWAGNQPHLASALLHHSDPNVTQEHYNRATSLSANQSFAALIASLRDSRPPKYLRHAQAGAVGDTERGLVLGARHDLDQPRHLLQRQNHGQLLRLAHQRQCGAWP
jgi:hypothetical protein